MASSAATDTPTPVTAAPPATEPGATPPQGAPAAGGAALAETHTDATGRAQASGVETQSQQGAGDGATVQPASADRSGQQQDPAGDKAEAGQSRPEGELQFEIAVPDGAAIDRQVFEAFEPLAQELAVEAGLDGEKASTLFSRLLAFDVERRAAEQKAGDEARKAQSATWAKEWQADPDLGGSDEKVAATAAGARQAMEHICGGDKQKAADAMSMLERIGLAEWPPFVKTFAQFHKHLLADDRSSVRSSAPAGSQQLTPEGLYNHPTSVRAREQGF